MLLSKQLNQHHFVVAFKKMYFGHKTLLQYIYIYDDVLMIWNVYVCMCGKRAIVFKRTKDMASTPPETISIMHGDCLYDGTLIFCVESLILWDACQYLLHIDNQ